MLFPKFSPSCGLFARGVAWSHRLPKGVTRMRPWHEIARLVGLEEGAGVPEPIACNPIALAHLGRARLLVGGATLEDAYQTMETFCREENVKPAVLLAACREVELGQVGQPEAWHGRRLISSGKVGKDGSIIFRFHGSN